MNIRKKLYTLINDGSLGEVNHILEGASGTVTVWCSRAIEHKDYAGDAPLYWIIKSLAEQQNISLLHVEAWERLKENLIVCYNETEKYLTGPADYVARLLVYLREFIFREWRPMTSQDFRRYLIETLDSEEYQKKRDTVMMIPDFWSGYQERQKARLIRRLSSSLHTRRSALLACGRSHAFSASDAS